MVQSQNKVARVVKGLANAAFIDELLGGAIDGTRR